MSKTPNYALGGSAAFQKHFSSPPATCPWPHWKFIKTPPAACTPNQFSYAENVPYDNFGCMVEQHFTYFLGLDH